MAACLLTFSATAADSNAVKTQQLIAVLQSNAPLFDKARACQQLGEFGDRDAVPALAALLTDEHLNAYARSGLEGIPDPSAAAALRTAAASLKGQALAGVINSLGVLRDAQAVGFLRKLAEDPASSVVAESMLALGRIATKESLQFLQLSLGKPSELMQTNAAAACLLAAEKRITEGDTSTAAALYDAVRKANVPMIYRAGATRGAIVARKAKGVPLLIEQLRSPDLILRNAALITIREVPSDALASALNAELDRSPVELQIIIITALMDCHNAKSLQALQAKVSSEDATVRKTALIVLGKIGGAAEAGVLIKAVAAQRNAEDTAVALNSLGRMAGAAIDAQIVKALGSTADVGVRVSLMRLAEIRGMTNASRTLLGQAADPDIKVSIAALRALKAVAGPAELPALIAFIKTCKDEAVRENAENAVVGASGKAADAAVGGEMVIAELQQAADPALRNSWVRILASLGYGKSLPVILAIMTDANESVAANAIEQIARWPDPSPIDNLVVVAQTSANPALRKCALTSIIKLATTAAEERQRPAEVIVKWFQRAIPSAQTIEDRRLIISGLGRLKHIESFRLLAPYLADVGLQNEAAVAIIQIAPALKQEDPIALKEALDKIVATTKNASILSQAARISATLPNQGKRTLLFDGQSLAGWEGSTNVWRVRDGVIIGGTLNGNPQNEFLAAARNFTNFILRLEYKLIGTEGFINSGVQFRSVRTKQPTNEMSGFQADIGAGYSGFLYDESRRNKFLAQPAADLVKKLEKPGEWNRYEVRCAGPRIQILLNGEKTVDYTETDASLPLNGLIALQIHGGNKAEVSFRNITIEDIKVGME
jgi:HEAT repeat protein